MSDTELKKRYCFSCGINVTAKSITIGHRCYTWECSKCGRIHKRKIGK